MDPVYSLARDPKRWMAPEQEGVRCPGCKARNNLMNHEILVHEIIFSSECELPPPSPDTAFVKGIRIDSDRRVKFLWECSNVMLGEKMCLLKQSV